MSVTAVVHLQARPGGGGDLRLALGEALELTRRAAGYIDIRLFTQSDDPDALILIEQWESIEAHKNFAEFMASSGRLAGLAELMAAPPRTTHYFRAD